MMKTLKRLFWGIVFLLALVIAGGAWFVTTIDQQQWVAVLTDKIKEKTGYQLEVKGEVSLALWPTAHVALGDAVVTAPNQTEPLLIAETLQLGVAVMPLLNKQVQVEQLAMVSPVIHLERMGENAAAKKNNAAQPSTRNAEKGKQLGGAMFSLPKISMQNATIIWDEAAADGRVSKLDVAAALPSLEQSATAEGKVQWRGEMVAFDLEIGMPKALMNKQASPVQLALQLPFDTDVSYKGNIHPDGEMMLNGAHEVSTNQLRPLLAWLDVELGDAVPKDSLNQLNISSNITASHEKIAMGDMVLTLDGQKLSGSSSLWLKKDGSLPTFKVDIAAEKIDARPFLAAEQQSSWRVITAAHASTQAAPLPVEMLRQIRGQATWDIKELTLPTMVLTNVKGNLQGKASQLLLALEPMGLKGGTIALNAGLTHGNMPTWQANLNAQSIDMKQFLELFQDEASIEGTGNVQAQLASAGNDVASLKANLAGPVSAVVNDGVIKGMDVLQGVKELAVAVKPSRAHAWETTEFAELRAKGAMQSGVAQFSELFMSGPFLEVQGNGTANLMTTQLNLALQPYIVEQKKQADGTVVNEKKRAVPLRVTGSWEKAKVTPDVQAELQRSLQDPEKVERCIKNIRDKIKDGGAKELLDKLF